MGWSRGGKVKFFQQRKSHISKSLNALVKLSKKNGIAIDKKQVQKAKQKAYKKLSREYKIRKTGYEQLNVLDKKLDNLKLIEKPTKRQIKQMESLDLRIAKKLNTITNRWEAYQDSIGYITEAGEDERNVKANT